MTKRGDVIIFCRTLAPPQCPPHSPDATILIYLNDRDRGGDIIFCRILAPPQCPPHPPTPRYLTILMTERGGAIFRILAPPMPPPPSPDVITILMTERGGAIIVWNFGAPQYAPLPRRHNT